MQAVKKTVVSASPLADRVYASLRDMIATGRLRSEEPVSEVQLAGLLQVSRTPVREAVRRLVGENVLQITPKGVRAFTPSVDDLGEVYFTRALLEGGAALLAARAADRRMLQALARILAETKEKLGVDDYVAFTRLNSQFHQTILLGSGNRRIAEQLASLESLIVRYRRISLMFPEHVQRSYQDHTRIVELFEAGEPEAVEAFVRGHVLRAGARVVRAVLRMEGGVPRRGSTAEALLVLDQSSTVQPA